MINRKYILLILISSLFCIESIAVATKVKGSVLYKKKQEKQKQPKNQLKKGADLHNSDHIITGQDGFAKYVYLDDGTQIKVHNNTEVFVRGEESRRSILKQLKVNDGTVKLDIKKQTADEFTVITPTSVASVKGTSFWLDCSEKGGDKFYGESGIVSITNKASGIKRQLAKNTVASSSPDGTLDVRQITPNELKMLEEIESETGEDDGPTDQQEGSATGDESEIRIELEDESGNQKTIIIKVR